MNKQRAMEWITNGEVGISSKTMWSALFGVPYDRADFPYDADDFRRCYLFAQTAELMPEDFEAICKVYPWWRNIFEIWSDMAEALSKKEYGRIYDLIQDQKRYARLMYGAHRMVKVGEGTWYSIEMAKRTNTPYEMPDLNTSKKRRLHPLEIAAKNASFDLIGYIQKKFKESLIKKELWQKQ